MVRCAPGSASIRKWPRSTTTERRRPSIRKWPHSTTTERRRPCGWASAVDQEKGEGGRGRGSYQGAGPRSTAIGAAAPCYYWRHLHLPPPAVAAARCPRMEFRCSSSSSSSVYLYRAVRSEASTAVDARREAPRDRASAISLSPPRMRTGSEAPQRRVRLPGRARPGHHLVRDRARSCEMASIWTDGG